MEALTRLPAQGSWLLRTAIYIGEAVRIGKKGQASSVTSPAAVVRPAHNHLAQASRGERRFCLRRSQAAFIAAIVFSRFRGSAQRARMAVAILVRLSALLIPAISLLRCSRSAQRALVSALFCSRFAGSPQRPPAAFRSFSFTPSPRIGRPTLILTKTADQRQTAAGQSSREAAPFRGTVWLDQAARLSGARL